MIGKMRDRVTFAVRPVVTGGDGYGNDEGDFADQFTVQARVDYAKGSEEVLAERVAGVQPITITVRASPQTRQVDTGWRAEVVATGQLLNIKSVTPDAWRRWIEMVCEAGAAVG